MQLLSVNVSRERAIQIGSQTETTGLFKVPVEGPVSIGTLGLEGDTIVSTRHHGGADQAVYVYGSADYDWWAQELGRPLAPGTYGENLTVSGLASALLRIGDQLHVGRALFEITAPRIPCSKLAARMGDPAFVKRFRAAGRPGVYCRVIEPGAVRVGDPVRVDPYSGETLTVLEMFNLYYEKPTEEAVLRRVLAAPVAIRARQEYEARLAELIARQAKGE